MYRCDFPKSMFVNVYCSSSCTPAMAASVFAVGWLSVWKLLGCHGLSSPPNSGCCEPRRIFLMPHFNHFYTSELQCKDLVSLKYLTLTDNLCLLIILWFWSNPEPSFSFTLQLICIFKIKRHIYSANEISLAASKFRCNAIDYLKHFKASKEELQV